MPTTEERVLARCTPFAAQHLARLREHPLYEEILARLDAIDGPSALFDLDVEQALYEALNAQSKSDPQKP